MAAAASARVRKYLANEEPLQSMGVLSDRVKTEGAVRVGSGCLGVVLVVKDRVTNKQLAVKVISLKKVADGGDSEARIRREVKAMSKVEHPSLVRLIDVLACTDRLPHVSSEPPYLCIAMDFVADSEPLSNTLRRSGRSLALASLAVPQLASGLAKLHGQGIVHRDVWSENVLVSRRGPSAGSAFRAVLVDLGCAEFIDGEPALNNKLNIPYMSPEAASGQRQGVGDDCWALGLLIGEMLTGFFVRDRMGRSDIPIHFDKTALAEARREAAAFGGALGTVSDGLLESEAGRRISMQQVLAHCRSPTGAAAAALATAAHFQACQAQLLEVSRPASGSHFAKPGSALIGSYSTISSALAAVQAHVGFYVGQHVIYLPRSHNIRRHAVVMGRLATGHGWDIQLSNGARKEVDDTDMWRLTPAGAGEDFLGATSHEVFAARPLSTLSLPLSAEAALPSAPALRTPQTQQALPVKWPQTPQSMEKAASELHMLDPWSVPRSMTSVGTPTNGVVRSTSAPRRRPTAVPPTVVTVQTVQTAMAIGSSVRAVAAAGSSFSTVAATAGASSQSVQGYTLQAASAGTRPLASASGSNSLASASSPQAQAQAQRRLVMDHVGSSSKPLSIRVLSTAAAAPATSQAYAASPSPASFIRRSVPSK